MDLVRSCYRCEMRLQDGAFPVEVQWRFADRNADLIGVPTAFGSANWNLGEDLRFDSYLGEQASSRPWRNGSRPAGLIGKRLCFPRSWFTTGVPAGVTINQQVQRNLVPACCSEVRDAKGGVWVSGKARVTISPCDCLELPDTLKVTFVPIGACAELAGESIATRNVGTCVWVGTQVNWLGIGEYRIAFANGDWTFGYDCFTGIVEDTRSGTACMPVDLHFTLVDDQACCSFTPGNQFVVRVRS